MELNDVGNWRSQILWHLILKLLLIFVDTYCQGNPGCHLTSHSLHPARQQPEVPPSCIIYKGNSYTREQIHTICLRGKCKCHCHMQKKDGERSKGKGRHICFGGRFCSIPSRTSCFASIGLEETVEFILFLKIDRGNTASAAKN